MFKRILIANRGEIAVRIARTARRLGIGTVAVFSEADRHALHVRCADHAVCIGPAAVGESYLVAERIIAAALETGAEAIHPGYGFLSENPEFVEKVEAAGLVFIGPSAASIRAMGLKDAAKRLMEKAGVPVVPGYHGEAQEIVILAGKANEIGYPVLIKARAGGGGKGMRKVDTPEEFREALAAARREAKAAFGDDRVLVEKYVEKPRHIEVQVFGDSHGNVVHLFERDCSLQRRHQKVIEEAPAPGMTPAMREAMTQAAVKAARAIDYRGAGTIEFIVDGSNGLRPDGFWFMEMNTRLQVEHPVTETVTGLDLVEWQLRVAAGERLPKLQPQITLSGHAAEARLYAEDAARGFLPAIGTLHHLSFPAGARIDAGIEAGDTIEPWYDPMIAKVITGGATREAALSKLAEALEATRIAGSVTNAEFLARLVRHPDFVAGDVDTGLIARDLDRLVSPSPMPGHLPGVAALAVIAPPAPGGSDPFDRVGSWALWEQPCHYCELEWEGAVRTVTISPAGNGRWLTRWNGGEAVVAADQAEAVSWPGHVTVFAGIHGFTFRIPDVFHPAAEGGHGNHVLAPMPGLVKIVHVAAGQSVRKGSPLLVLEAMKMEHSLTSPRDGVIEAVAVATGAQVTDGTLLVSLEAETGA